MSNDHNKGTGRYLHKSPICVNNPQKSAERDWWDELCKAHGEKNHWKKEDKKTSAKAKAKKKPKKNAKAKTKKRK
tara:strand:+ start:77 stop:301 length:225 start_codon:yes stop_codon:yes gene_type:complete